jgi:esterase/lipase superfamily enzyme
MLVFGETGKPFILFPQAGGRYYDLKDNGFVHALSDKVNNSEMKLYCPDTIDNESWLDYEIDPAERVKKHLAYEKLILNDVVGFAKYETEQEKVGLIGVGLGGYHALNLALKYPDKFHTCITFSGLFNIKRFIYGYYDENCYFNNPVDYLPGLKDDWYINHLNEMQITIYSFEHDDTLHENIEISSLLNDKSINHNFHVRNGVKGDWGSWNKIVL